MTIGQALRRELKKKHISQAEFARRLNVHRGTINSQLKAWDNGKLPSVNLLKKWCTELNSDYKKFLKYM